MAKIIDRIKYRPKGQQKTETVVVRMEADLRGANFTCRLDGDDRVRTEGKDLDQALTAIRKLIDEKFAIQWSKKLRVKFSGSVLDGEEIDYFTGRGDNGICENERGVRIDFDAEPMYVGKNADGQTIYRQSEYSHITEGDPCEVTLDDSEKETISLIDDTAENRERLAEIFKAFDALHKRLLVMFHPKRIEQTLQLKNLLGMDKK